MQSGVVLSLNHGFTTLFHLHCLPVAAEKLVVRTMDNSWCPRSLSIKLSGKENVGLIS